MLRYIKQIIQLKCKEASSHVSVSVGITQLKEQNNSKIGFVLRVTISLAKYFSFCTTMETQCNIKMTNRIGQEYFAVTVSAIFFSFMKKCLPAKIGKLIFNWKKERKKKQFPKNVSEMKLFENWVNDVK